LDTASYKIWLVKYLGKRPHGRYKGKCEGMM